MTKAAIVVGARPQFIKIALFIGKLRGKFDSVLIHTGQHYDYNMSKIFFDELGIPDPDYHLQVGSANHGEQTGLMLQKLEPVLLKESPDVVLVCGDTNSTLAGALVASKLNIPVAHIEAGLRSFNRTMPEEINRVITDHISKYLFCPTETSAINLSLEGIVNGVHLVGDVMYDTALYYEQLMEEKRPNILHRLGLFPKCYFLATIHRPQNTDNAENLGNIVGALSQCPLPIILPLHPRTRGKMGFIPEESGACHFISPVSYLDMLVLEKNALAILTDSGGVQKEAYFFKVPCITFRDETEWVETVDDGWNVLTGANKAKILLAVGKIGDFRPICKNRYGDGNATDKIIDILVKELD